MKNSTFANPEVFVGIAGPIGIDIDAISEEISQAFSSMGYSTESISITKLMTRYKADLCEISKDDYISVMNSKMDYANE